MLKLYELWTNTGDWDGIVTEYVIAESKEEAEKKSDYYQRFKARHKHDYFCEEVPTEDILWCLLRDREEAQKYKVTFTIEKKEEE